MKNKENPAQFWNDDVGKRFVYCAEDWQKAYEKKQRALEDTMNKAKELIRNQVGYVSEASQIEALKRC